MTDLVEGISNEKASRQVWRILDYAYITELKEE